ncbi:hypothetical protein INN71_04120 [Nocardioides sp. ChNu-153]|uniref:DUF5709 domain-containing protein n=1 Tax=unclassified Nocardioides TaxID=2615069 RepID=UPI00240759BA|nr:MULTISPECIES: DUF5709 domain-containing protein [unclassified Nocardioides]MDF9715410.1 hypothetical protein [Nocardioides sp. ChNu-99]MDN7120573.1 hypothetical protein [Nocardioides sp. ChNu-153]
MSEEQLQPQDTLDDRGVDDVLDEGFSPPEHLRGSNLKDVTAAGELEGETIDERLRQEEPEEWAGLQEELDADVVDGPVGGEVGGARTGRLVAEADGTRADEDHLTYAEDEGIDGAGASAEEAAMHTIDPDDDPVY